MLLLLLAQAPQCCSIGAMEDVLPLIWSLTFSWGQREGFLGAGIVCV